MAQADEIVDAVNDMINKRIAARNETDERKKSTMTREVMSETIPATLVILYDNHIQVQSILCQRVLEARLEARGGQFFAGNNLTWADLHVFSFIDRMREDNPELLDECPKIKNLVERVEQEPNIARWLQSRPQTLM